jgi:hypothetical protein
MMLKEFSSEHAGRLEFLLTTYRNPRIWTWREARQFDYVLVGIRLSEQFYTDSARSMGSDFRG